MKTKNKHGRKGVKSTKSNKSEMTPPDAEDEKSYGYGFMDGRSNGLKIALESALVVVSDAKTIREARKRIQELHDNPNG